MNTVRHGKRVVHPVSKTLRKWTVTCNVYADPVYTESDITETIEQAVESFTSFLKVALVTVKESKGETA